MKNKCPEFPYWGASYPDARCINGKLYDLDNCNDSGLLEPHDDIPCPICRTDEFIKLDPFGWVDYHIEEMEENGDIITLSLETKAKELARQDYIKYVKKIKANY